MAREPNQWIHLKVGGTSKHDMSSFTVNKAALPLTYRLKPTLALIIFNNSVKTKLSLGKQTIAGSILEKCMRENKLLY